MQGVCYNNPLQRSSKVTHPLQLLIESIDYALIIKGGKKEWTCNSKISFNKTKCKYVEIIGNGGIYIPKEEQNMGTHHIT